MMTRNEIHDALMQYLEEAIFMGFFSEEEVKDIQRLDTEYYLVTDESEDDLK